MTDVRRIVRYRNRKLYEARERRFVTLEDLARAVSNGVHVEVTAADSGEDITARVLSRALASGKAPVAASADTLARILRAGSEAAETVAGAAERVGATGVAATLRVGARVTLTPFVPSGASGGAALHRVTSERVTWALPWTILGALLVLGAISVVLRRRSRRRAPQLAPVGASPTPRPASPVPTEVGS